MNNEIRTWSQEYPLEHWPEDYINVKDKIILDLGCGLFGLIDAPYYQLNTCTTNYWMTHAAKKVIGLDMSETDIAWLRDNVIFTEEDENGNLVPRCTFFVDKIDSPEKIKNYITQYNVDIVKSDIEGFESILLDMPDEDFSIIEEYYIETHTEKLYEKALEKLIRCNYKIRSIMHFAGTPLKGQSIKLIFAYKNK